MTAVCAWCPDFNPADPASRGATHVICETCQRRIDEFLAMRELEKRKSEHDHQIHGDDDTARKTR